MALSEADSSEVEECRRLAVRWAPTLHALANPERLLIALWLAGSTCSVRELERVTGLGQSLVSYHLRELREAGLVIGTPSGRTNHYRLSNPDLDQLVMVLGRLRKGQPKTDEDADQDS